MVLGGAAIAAVTVAIVVTLASHNASSPRHDATARYIVQVDDIERRMQLQLAQVADARAALRGPTDAALVRRLSRADAALLRLQRRLQELPAPKDAARLKRLLVQLAREEREVGTEGALLAQFVPRFAALLRVANAARQELGRRVAAAVLPAAKPVTGSAKQIREARRRAEAEAAAAAVVQADAVDVYDARIAVVLHSLSRLHVPPAMRPIGLAERRTLAATQRAGRALSRALRSSDSAAVAGASRRFELASRGATTYGVQRLQIAAVRAYDARVRSLGGLQARIQAEVTRLQSVTG